MSSRREARERVLQALYAQELSDGGAEHAIKTILRPELGGDTKNFRFAKQLFLRTLDRAREIDEIVGQHAENWDLDRIALIDRILLRMATCELLTFEDIPPKVSIDEVIEIAKQYSTDQSSSFINGILDAVLLDLHQQGRLEKSGRGLVGMESLRDRVSSNQ